MSTCKSCHAEITWIKTPAGKPHPLNAAPVKVWVPTFAGYFERTGQGERAVQSWRLVDGYTSHFATCPNAEAHRKPRATRDDDDAEAAAIEAKWQERQGEDYGTY